MGECELNLRSVHLNTIDKNDIKYFFPKKLFNLNTYDKNCLKCKQYVFDNLFFLKYFYIQLYLVCNVFINVKLL